VAISRVPSLCSGRDFGRFLPVAGPEPSMVHGRQTLPRNDLPTRSQRGRKIVRRQMSGGSLSEVREWEPHTDIGAGTAHRRNKTLLSPGVGDIVR